MILENGSGEFISLEKKQALSDKEIANKVKRLIKENGGHIVKDVQIGNNIYCVKPLDDSQASLDVIESLYGNAE